MVEHFLYYNIDKSHRNFAEYSKGFEICLGWVRKPIYRRNLHDRYEGESSQ